MSLRYVLLALLSKEPNSGYGAGRLLQSQLRHLWEARLQQIYGELARLQADGLVEVQAIELHNRPAKKVYSVTPAGRHALAAWLLEQPAIIMRRDDLLVRLYAMEAVPLDRLIQRLEERRDAANRDASYLRERIEGTPSDSTHLGEHLTLDAALARSETESAWCERALSRLRENALP